MAYSEGSTVIWYHHEPADWCSQDPREAKGLDDDEEEVGAGGRKAEGKAGRRGKTPKSAKVRRMLIRVLHGCYGATFTSKPSAEDLPHCFKLG